jgi:hypothetical protein
MRKGPGKSKQTVAAVKRARAWPKWRLDWIAAAAALVLLAWLVTEGDWDFFPRAGFLERFYDGQARSLIHGRIDVAPEDIEAEAFVRDGKYYGYFGPSPALARIPFVLAGLPAQWNRVSMLLASVLAIGMLLLLLRRLEAVVPFEGDRWLRQCLAATLVVAAAIGSTNLVVSSESKVYQEALIWGSALAFAETVCLACYLLQGEFKWLAWSCATAFLAFFARVSSGVGAVFSLALVGLLLWLPAGGIRNYFGAAAALSVRRARVMVAVTVAGIIAVWGALNYWKFGDVFARPAGGIVRRLPEGSRAAAQRERELVLPGQSAPDAFELSRALQYRFREHFSLGVFHVGRPGLGAAFPQSARGPYRALRQRAGRHARTPAGGAGRNRARFCEPPRQISRAAGTSLRGIGRLWADLHLGHSHLPVSA